jgi:hypothetical protein
MIMRDVGLPRLASFGARLVCNVIPGGELSMFTLKCHTYVKMGRSGVCPGEQGTDKVQ